MYEADGYGKQEAKKFLRLKRLPPVLQININRFGMKNNGNFYKINSRCEFKETLDLDSVIRQSESYSLSQNVSSQIEEKKEFYFLHAILVHHGSLNSGHYYCYIRPGVEDKWFKFNDAKVSEVSKVVAFNTGIGGYLSKFELQQSELG